jgi:hypothetical protein
MSEETAPVGTPTLMIFGPTPHTTLGRFPPNVKVMRAGLPCEPCWFSGARFRSCDRRIDCLRLLLVDEIESAVRAWQRGRERLGSSVQKVHV